MKKVNENEHIYVYKNNRDIKNSMTDTLDNLRRRIASLYNENDPNDLGNIALEVILKRNEARSELEHDPTLDKKHEIQRRIDELHEFERAIVSLYMLQGVTPSSEKFFDMSDFTKTRYQVFNKKVIS